MSVNGTTVSPAASTGSTHSGTFRMPGPATAKPPLMMLRREGWFITVIPPRAEILARNRVDHRRRLNHSFTRQVELPGGGGVVAQASAQGQQVGRRRVEARSRNVF